MTDAQLAPAPPLTLTVGNPQKNSQINVGETLAVTGLVGGRGLPEPVVVETVTVQLGDQAPVRATLKPPHLLVHAEAVAPWTYVADLQVTVPAGPTAITVQANFGAGQHLRVVVPVFASLGGNPLASTFTGTATLQTNHSDAAGPYTNPISIETMFSGDLQTVVITNFPPISHPVSTPIGDDTITVTLPGQRYRNVSAYLYRWSRRAP